MGMINSDIYTYDAVGRRLTMNVAGASVPVMETTYGYDNANRLRSLTHTAGATTLENLVYDYDANGARTWMERQNVTLPLRGDGATPTCGTTNYTFDVRGRLTGINGFNADCSSLTASFKYDALGKRTEKTINGVTTQYVYDGLDIIQEKQGGVVTANYMRTLNIDEPLLRITPNALRFYKTDALGSVIALTDDTGVVRTTYAYDPFGNVTVSGEASDNPFQYTGRENDGTGLYYYRARYYSPELQRFISEDPIGLAGGDVNFFAYVDSVGKPYVETNLYQYTGNNPINRTDPLGLWYIDVNISGGYWVGITAGVLISPSGVYVYGGGGIVTPGGGGSITWSPSDPTPGWTIGLQGQAGIAGQVGYSFGGGGSKFWEVGGGWPPGASLTGYYVFDRIKKAPPIKPTKCN